MSSLFQALLNSTKRIEEKFITYNINFEIEKLSCMLSSSRELFFCAGFIMNSISHEQKFLPHKKTNVTTLLPTLSLSLLRFSFEHGGSLNFSITTFLKNVFFFVLLICHFEFAGKRKGKKGMKTGSLQMLKKMENLPPQANFPPVGHFQLYF